MRYITLALILYCLITCQSHDECTIQTPGIITSSLSQTHIMKAIRVHQYGGPEVLILESDVPIPSPGPEEVLVRVKAVGVNPVETYVRSGRYARLAPLPYTPGSDCAGLVEELGPSVSEVKKGDRVYVSKTLTGSYAEYALVPRHGVHPLPDNVTFNQGAALAIPYITAYRALVLKMNIRPGEYVLIHGASGGVGVSAVQIAKAYGSIVIGTAGTDEGKSLVKNAGADYVFNHRDPDYIEKMSDIVSPNGGFNAILENNAHINLDKDLKILTEGGRVGIVGNRANIEINPRDTMAKESSIIGVASFHSTPSELKETHAAIQAGMRNGWLSPIVGKTFSLSNAAGAHDDIINGKGALGKSVLTVDD